jgi:hypothetical protein
MKKTAWKPALYMGSNRLAGKLCDLQCDIHLLGGENISAQQPHGRICCFDLLLLFTAFLWGWHAV